MEEPAVSPAPAREGSLEARARKRVRARNDFLVHVLLFVFGNAGMFVIWLLTGARYPWFLWVLVAWGLGLVGHALTLFWGPESEREERAVERELARMRPRREGR